jgi:hypothetical protein
MKAKLPRVYDFVVRKPFKSENDSFEKGKKFKAFVKSFVVKSNETGWIDGHFAGKGKRYRPIYISLCRTKKNESPTTISVSSVFDLTLLSGL